MSKNEQAGTTSTPADTAWADALEEQRESAGTTGVMDGAKAIASDLNLVMDIPVRMTVELGRTRMTIKELLALSQGSVVALEGLAGEPLDILINGYLIAQGEVVVVSDKFGIRITDIITPSERIYRLSR
ncbi:MULTISPECIES: flagellar motor switch protein FliN [unclassified Escherichia]|uniref:flagellar motor switch protein FliN n=1 Tax=Escherichia TaxID=561 RepID=UPI0010293E2B|nr:MULTISPECIES: flagellar motor switch protein FliN [unclassified Escherichia]TGB62297.1 flagellar motor switch protein FliN [Escherichia coli]RZM85168.1 flagellar motor switch protein FliN [Escherichia sp. E1V33]RZM92102.1 flagellar motor switch protein FliN [Escherichia sp. E14V5]RZN00804.1 flagellar motor switch protein FliN [Escherichia sp. E14V7]RZN18254.1 flagellar motor switch protein FliN [Escherichia sp. E14S1]